MISAYLKDKKCDRDDQEKETVINHPGNRV